MSYLYEKYDYSLFESRFRDYDRYDQFGYYGLKALYNYLEELASDCDVPAPVEVDVIGLCCEFTHYASAEDALLNYDSDKYNIDNIHDRTIFIECEDGSILMQDF